MEQETNEVMAKLLTTEVPIKIQLYKYRIEELQAEVNELEAARNIKTGEKRRVIPIRKRGASGPIDAKLTQLRADIDRKAPVFIEGILRPVTEAETWECRTEYTAQRIALKRMAIDRGLKDEALQAYDEAVDLTCNQVWIAKQVECALKKTEKKDDKRERLFSYSDVTNLDPRITTEIWNIYVGKLHVTQDQLKNSSAPATRTS